ncbi:MAG TPA: hypothetical protein VI363_09505 [Burkholderiales bacterium]
MDAISGKQHPSSWSTRFPGGTQLVLPVAASAFAIGFALVVLSNAVSVLFGPATQALLDSPAMTFYAVTHLITGSGLLLAGLIGAEGALRKQSDRLLTIAGTLGSASLAAIVVLETLSLWSLRYLE